MSLLDIPLEKITEADLRNLITAKISESSHLDYKQETYKSGDDASSEFLADISAFANTLGGDIVIGIAEKDGEPSIFTPFRGDIDKEIRRLESIALTGLEPRISNMRIRAIPIHSDGHVLIIRIPKSLFPPHRVIARHSNRFWARAGTAKYQPNVQQLRQLFNEAPQMAERIRSFQTDRMIKIAAGETPISLKSWGKVVIHVIPVPSFIDGRLADILQAMISGTHIPLPPDELNWPKQNGANLDGFLNYTHPHHDDRRSYAQFFRSGAIEGVAELRHEADGQSRFIGNSFTTLVIKAVQQYLEVLKAYETGLPVYVFVSLCNAIKTSYRHAPDGIGYVDTPPVGREIAMLPEIYLESYDVDVPGVLRPVFNVLWNAVGLPQCDMYDAQGQWKGATRAG